MAAAGTYWRPTGSEPWATHRHSHALAGILATHSKVGDAQPRYAIASLSPHQPMEFCRTQSPAPLFDSLHVHVGISYMHNMYMLYSTLGCVQYRFQNRRGDKLLFSYFFRNLATHATHATKNLPALNRRRLRQFTMSPVDFRQLIGSVPCTLREPRQPFLICQG